MTENTLSVEEAAERSGYSTRHVRRLVAQGHVLAERAGRRTLLVDRASLDEYVESMTRLGEQKYTSSSRW